MSKIGQVPFSEAYLSTPVGKLKIKESEYLVHGNYKVVDQGKSLVAGYINNDNYVRNDGPYILFGDHTCIVKFIDFPFVVGADGVRLYKASQDFDPHFLFYYLKSIKLPSDLYGRHSKYLEDLFVPKIDINRQREIAFNLSIQFSEIEKAREAADTVIGDIKKLRYLAMSNFLSEFESAEKCKIGDKANTTSGSTPSRSVKQYWEPAEIPWIKTGEIAFLPITKAEEYISKEALNECSLKLLSADTVLVAMYGQGKTRGQSAILKVSATVNQACFAVLPNDTWEPEFLQLWLMYSYENLRSISENRGGNQANLNGEMLNSFEVPCPPKDVQKEVVQEVYAALSEIDKLNESWKATLDNIKSLPNKLLNEVFNKNEYR